MLCQEPGMLVVKQELESGLGYLPLLGLSPEATTGSGLGIIHGKARKLPCTVSSCVKKGIYNNPSYSYCSKSVIYVDALSKPQNVLLIMSLFLS